MSEPDTDTGVSETTNHLRLTFSVTDPRRGRSCLVRIERGRAGLGGVAVEPEAPPGVVTHDERAVLCRR